MRPMITRRHVPALVPLLVLVLSDSSSAQGKWGRFFPTVQPPSLVSPCMSGWQAQGGVMLFGGASATPLDDTWIWNGVQWSLLQPATRPPGRSAARLVYDSARESMVLFGGVGSSSGGSVDLGDTWEWHDPSSNWLARSPTQAPAARKSFGMAYDSARARTVLFGGAAGSAQASFGDTWEWDGTDWTQVVPVSSPSVRAGMSMVYDASRARCVLFGGKDPSGQLLGDTWEWDGTNWLLRQPMHAPSPRSGAAMTYDANNGHVMLFGGAAPNSMGDTWVYNGFDWGNLNPAPAPSPRSDASLAFDWLRGRVVLFGGDGLQETWEHSFFGAYYATFGQGCQGTHGVPTLTLANGSPVIGQTVAVTVSNLPPTQPAAMIVGFSRIDWLGTPLPASLAPVGMTGCTLHVSIDLITAVVNWSGYGAWAITIPNVPQLVGRLFFNQVAVLDLPANPFGMTVSNAGEALINDL